MKRGTILIFVSLLASCSSTPTVKGYEQIEKMERRDVVRASEECVDAGMKPYIEYVTQKTNFGKVLVPINVHCDPKRR